MSLTQDEEGATNSTQESEYQPEVEWVVFPQDMREKWEEHRTKEDPHIPELESRKQFKNFIGRFPQPFLHALRTQTTPYKFLNLLPMEITARWQDALYAQAIFIQLQELNSRNTNAELQAWLDRIGDPTGQRFSVYTRLFYNKVTSKAQWQKLKKLNYWGSEALAALDVNSLPQSKVLAVAAELYGPRLPTETHHKVRPEDYLGLFIDLWETQQESILEEGLRDEISSYVTLIQNKRAPLSPGY